MSDVHVNARVEVQDPGLAELRAIMRRATRSDPPANHIGTVEEISGDLAYILFDDTKQLSPYPLDQLRVIPGDAQKVTGHG